MIERLASALTRWCTRFIPDAYVIAGLLTVVVFGVALLASDKGPAELVTYWGAGFWDDKFMKFTLQMTAVILTGYIVADSPPVTRALGRLAAWPATPRAAVMLMGVVSMSLAWLNWGLSIVASAVLARRLGRRRLGVDFRLLVATAYLGLGCMWHAGLSASAPLTSSDPAQGFVKDYLKVPVPITATVFSPFNLLLALAVMVTMTLLAAAMQPAAGSPSAEVAEEPEPEGDVGAGPGGVAGWLERAPWVNLVLAAGVFAYLPLHLRDEGLRRININHVNLMFFGLGALLHGSPASLLRSAERAGRYVWGVLLQFPIYAGVAGILDKSGLASRIADGFTAIATPKTFPLLVVWYSGLLNYLVPSGGAKWFIEVQYLAEASRGIGAPLHQTIVAYAWGDMLTDIIQPFWAIPLLAVARLGFRDIMGYCLIFFLAYATLASAAFLAWGYF